MAMRDRCNNPARPNYRYYGGRGISVSPLWDDFNRFLADMGPRPAGHTLDRINGDGDYEPGNCRWADRSAQNKNRRQVVRGKPQGRLTEEAVRTIRKEAGSGATRVALSRRFGVSPTTIYLVVTRRTWVHVE